MTREEVIAKLGTMNRAQVARDTKLDYMWISRLYRGKIRYPRENFQVLVDYLQQQERRV